MNGPGDIPFVHSSTPDTRPCGLISIIPTLGMSSCRGRAEAFARRLSSKLRTLGSQADEDPISQEDEPIINGGSNNTWMTAHDSEQTVTDLQPLRHESDSFFDFDCELESPGSPVDECEYLRLIETASNTPHTSAAESGYVCASAASSQGSTDGPYYDVESAEALRNQIQARKSLPAAELPQYVNALKLNGNATAEERLLNGHNNHKDDDDESEDCNIERHDTLVEQQQVTEENTQADAAAQSAVNGCDDELMTLEMIRVQGEILSELHKQSTQINENSIAPTIELVPADDTECLTPTNDAIDVGETTENEKQTIACETCEDTTALKDDTSDETVHPAADNQAIKTTPAITHTITNGHTDDGDEVLKIETTEFENASAGQDVVDNAVACRESQLKEAVENQDIKAQQESPSSPTEEESKTTTTCSHHSAIDTTDDEDDCRPQRVRRCSSLKTGKTPPGTPGRKKIVRFADVLGLDLADIKTFLDEIPTIPKSAFEDLEIMDSEPPMQLGPKCDKLLMPLFQQPGGLTTFLDLVRERQVSLENAAITDPINQLITGSVRVRNLDFNKSVHIRYTLDGWRSYADLQANYVPNSCDGFSDKFTFVLFGNSLQMGQRLEFAVRFQCKGQQFWDNNYGTNYCFQCLPTTSPAAIHPIQTVVPAHHTNCQNAAELLSPAVGDAWCSSFY